LPRHSVLGLFWIARRPKCGGRSTVVKKVIWS
jgi:hypothetical protein